VINIVDDILLIIGAVIIFLWGVAHIIPVKSIVRSFGDISSDNKKIITMEWIAEGLTLCFIGTLVLLVTIFMGTGDPVVQIIFWVCAGMLIAMAILTALTGARTTIVPIKICPVVKLIVAILFIVAILI
jgi:hypothetical protein